MRDKRKRYYVVISDNMPVNEARKKGLAYIAGRILERDVENKKRIKDVVNGWCKLNRFEYTKLHIAIATSNTAIPVTELVDDLPRCWKCEYRLYENPWGIEGGVLDNWCIHPHNGGKLKMYYTDMRPCPHWCKKVK